MLKFTPRGYMLDKAADTMYVCSVPMKRKKSTSKCYFSKDKGENMDWHGQSPPFYSWTRHDQKHCVWGEPEWKSGFEKHRETFREV
ncbi:hypothetical protein OS493_031005 [Desmophyllum pertusum]|uniref:Uncharacterized protein n=1 Tax=Desmophyllum pertusum TaxID=174260 RepID=A0A9W9Z8M6_9CNID|nr:hypothetical protein OS493_031005 [Desmophyllum pertusum]